MYKDHKTISCVYWKKIIEFFVRYICNDSENGKFSFIIDLILTKLQNLKKEKHRKFNWRCWFTVCEFQTEINSWECLTGMRDKVNKIVLLFWGQNLSMPTAPFNDQTLCMMIWILFVSGSPILRFYHKCDNSLISTSKWFSVIS